MVKKRLSVFNPHYPKNRTLTLAAALSITN
jgi:hypothetical protein